jgi:hypothetical protein
MSTIMRKHSTSCNCPACSRRRALQRIQPSPHLSKRSFQEGQEMFPSEVWNYLNKVQEDSERTSLGYEFLEEYESELPEYPIIRDPFEDETLEEYLAWHDGPGDYGYYFTAQELTKLHRPMGKPCTVESRKLPRYEVPPRRYWPRMIPTRQLAGYLRHKLGVPLRVGNGWRPRWFNDHVCGASNSQHLYFAALDLDLIGDARKTLAAKLYEEAVRLYVSVGPIYDMGLGLYSSSGKGTRVHIDTGFKLRTWKKGYAKKVADKLGLTLPR